MRSRKKLGCPVKSDELTRAAAELSSLLGDSALLIGGLAVSAWGHVRATEDIDFVTNLEPHVLQERLRARDIRTELRRGDVLGGDLPWVLHGQIGDVSFQVLPPLVTIAWENAITVSIAEGRDVRIVSLRDLIHLKVRAGGPRDLWDVAELCRLNPEMRDDARRWASELDREAELDAWLNDPRLG